MKRIILKILTTIVAIMILGIIYFNIYNLYNIDSRIMFFIVFGSIMILLYVVPMIFYNDFEQLQNYKKTHTFKEFYEEYIERKVNKLKKIKHYFKKFQNNKLYQLLKMLYNTRIIYTICLIFIVTGIWYQIFFPEDFYSRFWICIIFFAMYTYVIINMFIEAYRSNKKSDYFLTIIYLCSLIINLIDFIIFY